jgi:transitional endoplasmic reticulum ATPase
MGVEDTPGALARPVGAVVDRSPAERWASPRCLVHLDELLMAELDCRAGDLVEILAPRGSIVVGRLGEALAEDRGSGVLRLDRFMRQTMRVHLDDRVEVRRVQLPVAESVTLVAPVDVSRAHHLGEHLREALAAAETPCVAGARVYIPFPGSQAGTVYEIADVAGGPAVFAASTEVEVQSSGAYGQAAEDVTLEDVGGLSQQVRLVRELAQLPLQFPYVYRQLGIQAPRGIILYGPPGCGKTHLARALARDVSASFYFIDGPGLVGTMQGETEANLRRVFAEAAHHAPSIVFIDEIDAIAPHRGQSGSQSDVRAVTTLLSLMDGLERVEGVVVIATTNRLDAVDTAMRRPGRFDREIYVGPPDRGGRAEILAIHTREMPLSAASKDQLARVAELTHGFVGADLMDLCREAGLSALRRTVGEPGDGVGAFRLPDDAVFVVEVADFDAALHRVRPSASREALVSVPAARWSDIGGLDDVKRTLGNLVEHPLRHLESYRSSGLGPVGGLLLHGPPGTGKTMLVHALAAGSGVNFLTVEGPELFSKWLGESEEALRRVFDVARQLAPAIVLFDQLDALAPHRGPDTGTKTTERVLSQLLSELDDVRDVPDIVVVGTTNRLDLIDPAVLRPGRFGTPIHVPLPDVDARAEIFRLRLTPLMTDGEPSPDLCRRLAALTDGRSGAELAGLVERARLDAVVAADDARVRLSAEDVMALIAARGGPPTGSGEYRVLPLRGELGG